jgi:hypothetical protein
MGIEELLHEKREEILQIAARHGARNVRVFGSVARGEADERSDVDLLIDLGPERTPWFPGGLIVDLENLLRRNVNIATVAALRPRIRERVLREAVPL